MAPPKKEGGSSSSTAVATEGSATGQPQQQVINLNLLELPQLQQFKTQVDCDN